MLMKKAKLFFSTLLVLLAVAVSAQNVQVSGVVSESNGDAVTGVAVQLKGSTTTYAMTDVFGGYRISVPSNGTLVFSCLGFKTVEIPVNGRAKIDVVLEADTAMLDETIVVAFGTSTKEAFTGSATVVNAESIQKAMDEILARGRNETVFDQWEAQILMRMLLKFTIIMVTEAPQQMVEDMHMKYAASVDDALAMAKEVLAKKGITDPKITVIPDGVSVIVK